MRTLIAGTVNPLHSPRPCALDLPQLPEQPARRLPLVVRAEDRLPHQFVHRGPAQARRVLHLHAAGNDRHGAAEARHRLLDMIRHCLESSEKCTDRSTRQKLDAAPESVKGRR